MSERRDLLVEIGTEELPPGALRNLAATLADDIHTELDKGGLKHGDYKWYATPRRLAIIINGLQASQDDHEILRRGPALSAAYDEAGGPTKAAAGFARSCGVEVSQLDRVETDKGEWLAYRTLEQGKTTTELLPDILETALSRLPVPKRMRWGNNSTEFVRPVHWTIVLFGKEVVPCTLLGTTAGNLTRGHRFHHPDSIPISMPDEYPDRLKDIGFVLADFDARQKLIQTLVENAARECGGLALIDPELMNEVTALTEWPTVVTGIFDKMFLDLPREVLIATMQSQQKYFPVMDKNEQLLANFITIANIDSTAPDEIKKGNERVIRPRLSDAAFFWKRDCRRSLAEYNTGLKDVIFQKKLGTLHDKTERIVKLCIEIAKKLNMDRDMAARSAFLAKCDLLTDMVGEFPGLQGIMGRYYAIESKEDEEVAMALEEQYLPRFAGGALPSTNTGRILAFADKLDTLVGIFAIGQVPTGEKDPFGLRRAALGCLRILIECELDLDLESCLSTAVSTFPKAIRARSVVDDVFTFMMERLRSYYVDASVPVDIFDAVLECRPVNPNDFNKRIHAVQKFLELPEAASLTAANKRISNILRQAGFNDSKGPDKNLLVEKAEKKLYEEMLDAKVSENITEMDYIGALTDLSNLRNSVDAFFDNVLVICDDEILRTNRLALLNELRQLFLKTADISRLQPRY
ncbi:MAG: glycine--tRNA ligase subunit beta [Gammaproteobacteria bacterium]